MALNGQGADLQKGEIPDRARLRQIDENGDAFARLWGEDRCQQARQAKRRKSFIHSSKPFLHTTTPARSCKGGTKKCQRLSFVLMPAAYALAAASLSDGK